MALPSSKLDEIPEDRHLDAPLPNTNTADLRRRSSSSNVTDGSSSSLRSRRPRFGGLFREPSSSKLAVCRESSAVDIETGTSESKACTVETIAPDQQAPMSPGQRWCRGFWGRMAPVVKTHVVVDPDAVEETASLPPGETQYRLKKKVDDSRGCIERWATTSDDEEGNWCSFGLTRYLNWTFRTSFPALIWQMMLIFWVITVIYALLYAIAGSLSRGCIVVSGKEPADRATFVDLYQLSWTTFSTVGYGLVYPNVSIEAKGSCYAVNALTALEAFTGVLYAATAGALLFGKVARSQSSASVQFSDPIVVRYGTGLHPKEDEEVPNVNEIPCPVMEFRMINSLHYRTGGEIINCSVNCVASITAENTSDYIRISPSDVAHRQHHLANLSSHFHLPHRARMIGGVANSYLLNPVNQYLINPINKNVIAPINKNVINPVTTSLGNVGRRKSLSELSRHAEHEPDVDRDMFIEAELLNASIRQDPRLFEQSSPAALAVMDEGSKLVPRRIFSTLDVETPSHPFFKRGWTIKHPLDSSSPLLSMEAKAMIDDNNGYWPESLNSFEKVRDHIRFHEIMVSLTGTANASGSTVYKQKVYSCADMNIGYTFATVLHQDAKGRLRVDERLLNDVREQNGGGGEPFVDVDEGWMDIAGKVREDVTTTTLRTTRKVVAGTADVLESGTTKTSQGIAKGVSVMKETTASTGEWFQQVETVDVHDNEESKIEIGKKAD